MKKIAEGADDSIDTDISRLNGKFSSRITLWWSSRLKYLNKKINREYCCDVKTTCQPAPFTGKVPDVACNVVLKMSNGLLKGG